MSELLSKFDGGELIGFVAVAGGVLIALLCGVTGIIAKSWQRVRREEITARLKQDMLNRGMSAEEIQTVIEAGSRRSRQELARSQSTP